MNVSEISSGKPAILLLKSHFFSVNYASQETAAWAMSVASLSYCIMSCHKYDWQTETDMMCHNKS